MRIPSNIAIPILTAGLLGCTQATAPTSPDAGQEEAGQQDATQEAAGQEDATQEDAAGSDSGDASGSSCNAFSGDKQTCLDAGCVMARNMDTGNDLCIESDLCRGLKESDCVTTPGCAAVDGYLAGDSQQQRVFVGCATGKIPGATMACTSAGSGEPCFVIQSWWAPDGWEFWGCGYADSQSECLANGPYAVDSGAGDGGSDS